ncbi:hypothetical protein DM02DRAFT_671141 [Periconia macrospinosa]|uniref:Uncharacterized protein n=1 Tax=Periconia macrospinosa TaxID=97972 RepID=A0A2V1DU24_9PLEO|nr:hypothetical protein DM02DRAFT_671141 [Periconia macrospinosa]
MSSPKHTMSMTENEIAEALGPEPDWASIDDEVREMRRGYRLQLETSLRLESQPEKQKLCADITVEFRRGRGSIKNQQRGLTRAFADHPVLQEKYAEFLQAEVETEEQRAEAAEKLCAIIGIPFQIPLPEGSLLWSECEFLSTVQDRLSSSIFNASDFADLTNGTWNDGVTRDVVYSQLESLLAEQPDLLSKLLVIWHGWDYQMRD